MEIASERLDELVRGETDTVDWLSWPVEWDLWFIEVS